MIAASSGKTKPRRFSAGGEFAAFCAQVAPWLGAAWASLLVLVPPPDGAEPIMPQASLFSWLLCACGFAAAFFMWKMIRSGLRLGKLSPLRLLIAGALPWAIGLLLTPLALAQIWYYGVRQGASIEGIIEPAIAPRLTGLVLGSQLLGAAGFALAVVGFLWRSPGRRWPGLWRALASLAPFMVFVMVWMALDRYTPLPLRAEWIGFALVTLPFRYALAGAVVTRPPAAEPGFDWALFVPLAGTILFMAAATLYFDQSLTRAFFAISAVDGAQAWPVFVQGITSAAAFALIGTVLLLLPEAVLLFRHHGRGSQLRQAALGHGRILLLACGLLLLEALANWHLIALIKDAVFAQPLAGPEIERTEPNSGALRDVSPPPPPPQATRTRPIEIPGNDSGSAAPPDFTMGAEPGPELEISDLAAPPVVVFTQLAQGAIRKPEFRIPDHLVEEIGNRGETKVVIVMKLVVGEDGMVKEVVLLKGSGWPEVDEHAIATARDWLFKPFLVNGTPTSVASSWPIIYQLQ